LDLGAEIGWTSTYYVSAGEICALTPALFVLVYYDASQPVVTMHLRSLSKSELTLTQLDTTYAGSSSRLYRVCRLTATSFLLLRRLSNVCYLDVRTLDGAGVFAPTPALSLGVEYMATAALLNWGENRFILAYRNESDGQRLYLRSGTVGASIVLGAPVRVSAQVQTQSLSLSWLDDSRFLLAYSDPTSLRAIVASVSPSGEIAAVDDGATAVLAGLSAMGSIDAVGMGGDSFVSAYIDPLDGNKGKVRAGTTDGATISLGSARIFESDAVLSPRIARLSPLAESLFPTIFAVSFISSADAKAIIGRSTGNAISISPDTATTTKSGARIGEVRIVRASQTDFVLYVHSSVWGGSNWFYRHAARCGRQTLQSDWALGRSETLGLEGYPRRSVQFGKEETLSLGSRPTRRLSRSASDSIALSSSTSRLKAFRKNYQERLWLDHALMGSLNGVYFYGHGGPMRTVYEGLGLSDERSLATLRHFHFEDVIALATRLRLGGGSLSPPTSITTSILKALLNTKTQTPPD